MNRCLTIARVIMDSELPTSQQKLRPTALYLTIAIHAALILLALIPRNTPIAARGASLKVFDVPQGPPNPDPKPAQPLQPVRVPPQIVDAVLVPPPIIPLPVPSPVVVAMLAQSDIDAKGGACDLTDPVRAALIESPLVQERLARMPRAHRSVANAIMVWNVDWIVSDHRLDIEALDAIRDVVAGTIAAASDDCRMQDQSGPRLIILPGADTNIVLALGSGAWRWQDVLQTARPDWSSAQRIAETQVSPIN